MYKVTLTKKYGTYNIYKQCNTDKILAQSFTVAREAG